MERAEAILKGMPRGLFRLTVMAPPRDVTGESRAQPKPASPMKEVAAAIPHDKVSPPLSKQADTQENKAGGIISETLQLIPGSSLGFEIEGGSDTPLNYVYIRSLVPNSPAFLCGRFREGDQLIMVGDACLIGMTQQDAKQVLDSAPSTVEIVAQRKNLVSEESPQSNASRSQHGNEEASQIVDTGDDAWKTGTLDSIHELETDMLGSSVDNLKTRNGGVAENDDILKKAYSVDNLKTHHHHSDTMKGADSLQEVDILGSLDDLKSDTLGRSRPIAGSIDILVSGSSTEDIKTTSTGKVRRTDPYAERHAQLCPEERMTVELTRGPGEKLGVGIVGGIDHPKLKQIHVSITKIGS